MKVYKLPLALLVITLLTNISLASNNTEYNNETNNTIGFFYSQFSYICYPYNLTNNNNLGECLTFIIYGLDNLYKNLDDNQYIYDEELNIYWLNKGISFHLIFHNESNDLGIANINYDEYIDFKNKIIDYFYTNGTILNETHYYVNGKLVAMKDNSGAKIYYHPDNLGSTTLVTNQSGSIVEEEFYLPYGDIYSGEEDSRFLYTGKEKEKDTGLYYYGARYYYPFQRQFIQPDPIIADIYNSQNLNRYAYVLNNPYKYTDPTGQYISPLDILDYVSLVASIIAFADDPSLENLGYVGVDVVSAAVPVLGGAGAFAKGAKVASKADEVDRVGDISSGLSKVDNVRNTGGRRGGPEHKGTIGKVADEIERQGGKIVSGGGEKIANGQMIRTGQERRVEIPGTGGKYRYPDVQARINGKDVFINVGRTKASGEKVTREVSAITDLSKRARTEFVPYDKPFDIQEFVGRLG